MFPFLKGQRLWLNCENGRLEHNLLIISFLLWEFCVSGLRNSNNNQNTYKIWFCYIVSHNKFYSPRNYFNLLKIWWVGNLGRTWLGGFLRLLPQQVAGQGSGYSLSLSVSLCLFLFLCLFLLTLHKLKCDYDGSNCFSQNLLCL